MCYILIPGASIRFAAQDIQRLHHLTNYESNQGLKHAQDVKCFPSPSSDPSPWSMMLSCTNLVHQPSRCEKVNAYMREYRRAKRNDTAVGPTTASGRATSFRCQDSAQVNHPLALEGGFAGMEADCSSEPDLREEVGIIWTLGQHRKQCLLLTMLPLLMHCLSSCHFPLTKATCECALTWYIHTFVINCVPSHRSWKIECNTHKVGLIH